MIKLKQSQVAALIYADIFHYPLTIDELNLYSIHPITQAATSIKAKNTNGYYHLLNRDHLVKRRLQREKISQKKLHKALSVAHQLERFSSIRGIFITGNLAMCNADESDDIDLMIITDANRLWTTRLIVTLYLEFFGLRRRPHEKNYS
jgi:hypothetical protein